MAVNTERTENNIESDKIHADYDENTITFNKNINNFNNFYSELEKSKFKKLNSNILFKKPKKN